MERTLYNALYHGGELDLGFALLDQNELLKLKNGVLHQVAHSGDSAQNLDQIFSKSMKALQARHPAVDWVKRFMHSSFFDTFIELPFVGDGVSREEAFYHFLKSVISPNDLHTLKQEYLFHAMKELAANPNPFFKIECEEIIPRKRGYIAILRDNVNGPYLYASLDGTFSHGSINGSLAGLIECKTVFEAITRYPDKDLRSTVNELQRRGMLD